MRLHTVTCPQCRTTLNSKAGVPVGVVVACLQCQRKFHVEEPKPAFEVVEEVGAKPAGRANAVAGDVIEAVEVVVEEAPAKPYLETLAPLTTPGVSSRPRASDLTSNLMTLSGVIPPPRSPDERDTLTQNGTAAAVDPNVRVEIPGYEIEAQLGHGGMGMVFRAKQMRLNRTVAIKMVHGGAFASSEARVRFLSEAESIAKLHHPHIVQVYEFGQHEGYPYFTLEYLEGGTLDRLLVGKPLKARRAAAMVERLARGTQHAHERGIVHRDLKPSNVLLDADGNPKISDFGLAKHTDSGDGMTRTGSILGTPSYMAPEQARGDVHEVGPHSDVYALGAILYECLTGRPPFRGTTTIETINKVLNKEPAAPRKLVPSLPRDIETLCLKCLQKNPGQRYASAAALADDLQRFIDGDAIKARPIGRIERTVRWAKRHPSLAALAAVVGFATLALVAGSWWYNLKLQGALTTAEARRKDAEEQKAEADRQKSEAERQRHLVGANMQRRLDVLDDLLVKIDGRLAQKEGMLGVRLEFLVEFRKISDQLLAEQGDDPAVRRQVARVYRTLGDLCLEYNEAREGEAAYATAVRLQHGLAAEFPENLDYQADYAATCLNRGILLWIAGQYERARASGQAAVDAIDLLVSRAANNLDYRQKAARYRFHLANFQEDLGAVAAARTTYEAALARQEQLAVEFPGSATIHADRADTLTALGLFHEAADKAAARTFLERALEACRKARLLAPQSRAAYTAWTDAIEDLYSFYRRTGLHAPLAALADAQAADAGDSNTDYYNAACVLGYAAAVLQADERIPEAEKAALMDAYAGRALKYLGRSVETGYNDRAHIATDPDLDPFRDRADFQKFAEQLGQRFPNRPVTPIWLFNALQRNYVSYETNYLALRDAARTIAARKRAVALRPSFTEFGDRILAIAEKNPEAPASLDALVWILETAPVPTSASSPVSRLLQKVLVALRRDHLTKPDFGNACTALAARPVPGGDDVLAAAQGPDSPKEVRGIAAYALALSLVQQAARCERTDPVRAAECTARAEQQLELVVRDYAGLPYGRGTLDELARKKLVELRTLSIGRPARNIAGTDLDGRPMKLSDFRGKVVLLDFWANWCGHCRAMYPYERQLVERLKGRPFALVGINCDETLDGAKRAVVRDKLTWRSWFDASVTDGRATTAWQVDAYPTMFLLDGKGIIRRKWQGRQDEAEIDAAIEQLLAELEGKKG